MPLAASERALAVLNQARPEVKAAHGAVPLFLASQDGIAISISCWPRVHFRAYGPKDRGKTVDLLNSHL